MLRKMRRSEVLAGQDPGLRPSFFQSSMPSKPDDRATTLKKIDEIEAQMSMQWWKTKHGGQSQQPGSNSAIRCRRTCRPTRDARGHHAARSQLHAHGAAGTRARREHRGSSAVGHGFHRFPHATAQAPAWCRRNWARRPLTAAAGWPRACGAPPGMQPPCPDRSSRMHRVIAAAGAVTFPVTPTASRSPLFAIDVEEFAHDPELEEASIRFANGDKEGAEG